MLSRSSAAAPAPSSTRAWSRRSLRSRTRQVGGPSCWRPPRKRLRLRSFRRAEKPLIRQSSDRGTPNALSPQSRWGFGRFGHLVSIGLDPIVDDLPRQRQAGSVYAFARLLGDERGLTLSELIVTMAILAIVLTAITSTLVAATHDEADLN